MTAVRVLHVDDEPDIREVVELSLSLDPDLKVRSCSSGGDALSAAVAWMPDLILLDVMMPNMDGPTTLTHLRQIPKTAEIPVVFMTARAQPRELEHFVSLGAEGVIAKPFDPMTLAASVRNYIGGLSAGIAARRASFLERCARAPRAWPAKSPRLPIRRRPRRPFRASASSPIGSPAVARSSALSS
jgi:CheY-like chemotaxis protein